MIHIAWVVIVLLLVCVFVWLLCRLFPYMLMIRHAKNIDSKEVLSRITDFISQKAERKLFFGFLSSEVSIAGIVPQIPAIIIYINGDIQCEFVLLLGSYSDWATVVIAVVVFLGYWLYLRYKSVKKTGTIAKDFLKEYQLTEVARHYVSRTEEDKLIERIQKNDFIQVFGVSGIGKTSMITQVGWQLKGNFEKVIWLSGDDFSNISENTEITVAYQNHPYKLDELLGKYNILILVDNLNQNVKGFRDYFRRKNKSNSRCVITSLQANADKDETYNLSYVDNKVSRAILKSGRVKPSMSEITKILYRVNGYPLILRLAVNAVDNGDYTWGEFISDINLPEMEDTERNQLIAKRIIGRYAEDCHELFSYLTCLHSTRCSIAFLRETQIPQYTRLVHSALIMPQANCYYCEIHSLVLACIEHYTQGNPNENITKDAVNSFFERHLLKKDTSLHTFVFAHLNTIENWINTLEADEEFRHKCVLAKISCVDMFRHAQEFVTMIDSLNLDIEHKSIDLRLSVEKQEMQFFIDDKSQRTEQKLAARMNAVAKYEQIKNVVLCPEDKAYIAHHQGKWMSKVDKTKSEVYFMDAISLNPKSYSSYMQLAKNSIKDDWQKSEQYIRTILGNTSEASVSTILSAYGLMSDRRAEGLRMDYIIKNQTEIKQIFRAAISEDNSQAYDVCAKLSYGLAYLCPKQFKSILDIFPEPTDFQSTNAYSYGCMIASLCQYGKLSAAEQVEYKEKGLQYLSSFEPNDDYQRKRIMDFAVAVDDLDLAHKMDAAYVKKDDPFYKFSKSRLLYTEKNPDALRLIDEAINVGSQKPDFEAAFKHLKGQILYQQKDPSWTDLYDEAIRIQPQEKSREDWRAEQRKMKAMGMWR